MNNYMSLLYVDVISYALAPILVYLIFKLKRFQPFEVCATLSGILKEYNLRMYNKFY